MTISSRMRDLIDDVADDWRGPREGSIDALIAAIEKLEAAARVAEPTESLDAFAAWCDNGDADDIRDHGVVSALAHYRAIRRTTEGTP